MGKATEMEKRKSIRVRKRESGEGEAYRDHPRGLSSLPQVAKMTLMDIRVPWNEWRKHYSDLVERSLSLPRTFLRTRA